MNHFLLSIADPVSEAASQPESSYLKRKYPATQFLCNLTKQFKSRRKKIGQLDKVSSQESDFCFPVYTICNSKVSKLKLNFLFFLNPKLENWNKKNG